MRFELNPITRMRFKLERWNLCGFPGRTAERFVRALGCLKDNLPPRVCAAVLRTCWNGWCTKRRFQKLGPCVFGCGAFLQADSLEHYSGCQVCVGFLRSRLRYLTPIDRGHLIVLGVHRAYPDLGALLRLALWNYVLYMSFNHCRHQIGSASRRTPVQGVFEQYLREAVNGHEGASAFL